MTLHDRIRAVVEERLRLAREATAGPWDYQATSLHMDGSGTYRIAPVGRPQVLSAFMRGVDPRFIAANDPADAILSAEYALWTLDEHKPRKTGPFGVLCEGCSVTEGSGVLRFVEYPCRSLLALATRWRVGVDG